ncbi:MAG TPA: Wzz/FepE/Etk N-terminal domain-containing protein [Petrotogaceae bacterium]|nr:Wzz/FepE/Etk N-terminal domain-containing protein [Petrotogaceae bacterium]
MNNDFNESSELTLQDILRVILRRKWLIFWIVFIAGILSVIYALSLPKIYEAQMYLEFKETAMQQYGSLTSSALAGLTGGSSFSASPENEIQKMKNREVLRKVVQKLELVEIFNDGKLDDKKSITELENEVIGDISEELSIQNMKNTSIIKLSYQYKDKKLVSEIIHWVYYYYEEFNRQLTNSDYNDFLMAYSPMFTDISAQYEEINKKVIDYELKNKVSSDFNAISPLFDAYVTNYSGVLGIDKSKKDLEISIKAFEKQYLEVDDKFKEVLSTETNPNLQSIKNQIITSKIELESVKVLYPNSAKIGEIETKISTLQQNFNEILKNILSNNLYYLSNIDPSLLQKYIDMNIQYQTLDMVKLSSEELLKKFDKEIADKSPVLYDYFLLKRDQSVLRSQYEYLRTSIEQARLKDTTYQSKFRILQQAQTLDKHVKPDKKAIVVVGGVTGIFVALFLVFVIELGEKKIKSIEEFKRDFGSVEITVKNDDESEAVAGHIIKTGLKKVGIMEFEGGLKSVGLKSIGRCSEIITKALQGIDREYVAINVSDSDSAKTSVENYSVFEKADKAVVNIHSNSFNELSAYKDSLEKVLLIIKENQTGSDLVRRVLESTDKVIYIYVKSSISEGKNKKHRKR